jgi:hypothetical protein
MFIQTMLRSTTATMAAPALSGAVSSATARGYLPQYRGTAAASLAPAMLNIPAVKNGGGNSDTKLPHPLLSTTGVTPLIAANFLPENRPLYSDRSARPIRSSVEAMSAEAYARHLAQKNEDQKILEQGWNSKTTGTGPTMGSDW